MKNVLSIDAAAGTVTVEPAITWEKLDQALKPDGLTLRLYPTSYPSSSVGGWLAQGGAGIGSYEFGWFKENVVSARSSCRAAKRASSAVRTSTSCPTPRARPGSSAASHSR